MNIRTCVVGLALLVFVVAGCGGSGGNSSSAEQDAALAKAQAEKAIAEAELAKAQAEAELAKAQAEAANNSAASAMSSEKDSVAVTAAADKNPVDELEKIASGLKGRRQVWISKSSATDFGSQRLSKKVFWTLNECRVNSVAYDVEKTESLVSPFRGTIKTNGVQINYADAVGNDEFPNEAAASAALGNAKVDSTYSDETTHYFAWQNDEWKYKFSEYGEKKMDGVYWPLTPIKRPGQQGRFRSVEGISKILIDE